MFAGVSACFAEGVEDEYRETWERLGGRELGASDPEEAGVY